MKIPTRAVRSYNSIHRQQLFHWIGSHLDVPSANRTATQRQTQRKAYVECLRSALDDGIWLRVPRKPDQLGDCTMVKVSRAIACFTEWPLSQSLPHTGEYGRLGLGFPKRFVLSRGGQPVIYARDANSNARYVNALCEMAQILIDRKNGIPKTVRSKLWKNFDFITHFVKSIQKRPKVLAKRNSLPKGQFTFMPANKALGGLLELMHSEMEKDFKRKFGRFLHYLEEREWRIVYDSSLGKYLQAGPGGNAAAHYLPFKPGTDLFTVVVPDALTVSLVMNDDDLRKKLFPAGGVPVTLLALEDIGTF